jgi:hypothetical protein
MAIVYKSENEFGNQSRNRLRNLSQGLGLATRIPGAQFLASYLLSDLINDRLKVAIRTLTSNHKNNNLRINKDIGPVTYLRPSYTSQDFGSSILSFVAARG